MACQCKTGARRLVLQVPDLAEAYPELSGFEPGGGWCVHPERDLVVAEIGPGGGWLTVRELVNYLRGELDPARLARVRGAWAEPDGCGADTAQPAARHFQPVMEMAPLETGPLWDLLEHRRIETWYQPIFRAGGLAIWGYECLLRGRTAEGEQVGPGEILDWARQEQLVFMLDRICREQHLLNAGQAGLPAEAHVLINFMPTSVYDPRSCLRTTVQAASRSGLSPSRVIFEVVESEKVDDQEHLLSILAYYRRSGFKVALDDVGAGYSGLMMLADLEPDLVKIDRGLVTRAAGSELCMGICRSLVELAHGAGKLALAEGVETAEQKRIMDEVGVDLFQGFYFGKPQPEPVTEALCHAAA